MDKENKKDTTVENKNSNNDSNNNNKDWRLLSDEEKQILKLNGKKNLKKVQKEVCENIKCLVCKNHSKFTSLRMYKLHLLSKKHLMREQRLKIGDTWSCKICKLDLPNESEWNKHSIGKKHLKNMKLYSEKNYSLLRPYFESDLKDIKQSEFKEETDDDDGLNQSYIG